MSDDTLEIGAEENASVAAELGSQENPMTEEQAVAAGIDVEKVKAEAEEVLPEDPEASEGEKGEEEVAA